MSYETSRASSSKLSTRETLLRLLDNYENSAREVVELLVTTSNSTQKDDDLNNAIAKSVTKVIQGDEELQAAVKVGEEQLSRQQDIIHAKEEMYKKNQELIQIQAQLKDAEQVLANALYHAQKKVESLHEASKASVSSEELIKFAFRISSGSAVEAPTDWTPGDPRRPYPLDMELRAGHLGHQLTSETDALKINQIEAVPKEVTEPSALGIFDQLQSKPINSANQEKAIGINLSETAAVWHSSKVVPDQNGQAVQETNAPASSLLNDINPPRNNADVEFMSSSGDSSTSSDSS